MSDVGLGKLIPEYYRKIGYLCEADFAYWEALYDDGTVLRETDGKKYADIDRDALQSFRIVHHGEIVLEIRPPEGATGQNLVYRRRITLRQSGLGRDVHFILGFAPMGPYYAVDLDGGVIWESAGFTPDGLFAVPELMPGEPENLLKGTV